MMGIVVVAAIRIAGIAGIVEGESFGAPVPWRWPGGRRSPWWRRRRRQDTGAGPEHGPGPDGGSRPDGDIGPDGMGMVDVGGQDWVVVRQGPHGMRSDVATFEDRPSAEAEVQRFESGEPHEHTYFVERRLRGTAAGS